MKPVRKIERVVDLIDTQGRVVLWMECKHKISLTQAQLATQHRDFVATLIMTGETSCPFCPDEPEQPTLPASKSANTLWREAGEP